MDERTVILLRHGKSDWSGDEDDAARPLAPRGRRQVPATGRWLNENVAGIDVAIVSPAVRAATTWEMVAAELASAPPVRIDERVYGASVDDLLTILRGVGDDVGTVLVVGHNPGLEELVLELTGVWTAMPTSAVALIAVPGHWADVGDEPATLSVAGRPPDEMTVPD